MHDTRPTFLGIGAPRSGTTWLYDRLIKHPQVWMPPVKEIHFFDRAPSYISPNDLATASPMARLFGLKPWEAPRTALEIVEVAKKVVKGRFDEARWRLDWAFGVYDEDWYCKLFSQGKEFPARGEITPAYSILNREDVAKIKALNPDIKLLFLVRNPIERIWSSVRYNANRGMLNVDINSADAVIAALEENKALEGPETILRGDYERTLENYLEHFETSQLLIGFYDAISCDPGGLLQDVTGFLGIEPLEAAIAGDRARINSSPARGMPAAVRDYLLATHAPMIRKMARTLGSYATQWETSADPEDGTEQRQPAGQQLPPTIHLQNR